MATIHIVDSVHEHHNHELHHKASRQEQSLHGNSSSSGQNTPHENNTSIPRSNSLVVSPTAANEITARDDDKYSLTTPSSVSSSSSSSTSSITPPTPIMEDHTPILGHAAYKMLHIQQAYMLLHKAIYSTTPWLPKSNIPRIFWFSRFRHQINTLFSDVDSRGGFLIIVVIALVILLSVLSFCISTLPEIRLRKVQGSRGVEEDAFDTIEVFCVTIFTVEYLIRLITCTAVPTPEEDIDFTAYNEWKIKNTDANGKILDSAPIPPVLPIVYTQKTTAAHTRGFIIAAILERGIVQILSFIFNPLNIIDVAAVAPFYYSLQYESVTDGSITILRVLRLSRVLRLLRLSHRNHGYRLLMRTLINSADALFMLFYLITLGVILFGSILFYCESGEWDDQTQTWLRPDYIGTGTEESPFRSILVSFWWAVVTMATVGYGDLYPTTGWGRALGSVVIVFGLITIALPITIIGSNFSDEYSRYRLEIQFGGDGFSKTMEQLEEIQMRERNRVYNSIQNNYDAPIDNNYAFNIPAKVEAVVPPKNISSPIISSFFLQDPAAGIHKNSPTKTITVLPGTVNDSTNVKGSGRASPTGLIATEIITNTTNTSSAIDSLRTELTNELTILRKENEGLRNQLETIVTLLTNKQKQE